MTQQFVCGDSGCPVSGQTLFFADFLKNAIVNFIIVNNAIENQLAPGCGFTHNYVQGCIDRSPNTWSTGDKLIVDYNKCKCE